MTFQRTYSVFYKEKFIRYSLWRELFCVLYQLHHRKQVRLEDVPHAEKMESVRSEITGARHAKCHFAWYCALKNATRKATEFLKFFFFLNFISFFVGIVNFLSNCSSSSSPEVPSVLPFSYNF